MISIVLLLLQGYKCYALVKDEYSLFVLFNDTCPTYAIG